MKVDNSVRGRCAFALIAFSTSGILGILFETIRPWLFLTAALFALLSVLIALRAILWASSAKRTDREAAVEIHSMMSLMRRFPECTVPTTKWSMRFRNLHEIVELLDKSEPHCIVELGSGISTVCLAAWLKERGRGRVYSFEHDSRWCELTARNLTQRCLEEFAVVTHAPLVPFRTEGTSIEWYDLFEHVSNIAPIDFVVVDGPPAGYAPGRARARAPAMAVFEQYMSGEAIIVLDDATRSGERAVIRQWRDEAPNWNYRMLSTPTGLAIFERSGFLIRPCESALDNASPINRVAPGSISTTG